MTYQYPMERVLYNLHHQVCTFALQRTSSRTRSLAEHFLLLLALGGFGALLLAHLSFVYRGNNSIARIETGNVTDGRPVRNIPLSCLSSIPGFVKNVDITHLSILKENDGDDDDVTLQKSRAFQLWSADESESDESTCAGNFDDITVIYSYSKVRGYLLLPSQVCAQHNVSVQHVMVSKTDVRCFGEPFLQYLIFQLLAPDSVMLNWLLATHNATGFVYDPRTEALMDLSLHYSRQNNNFLGNGDDNGDGPTTVKTTSRSIPWYRRLSSKLAVVLKTSFLFFILTTLVSFTLRETQERMLGFTHQLQAHVRSRRSVVNIVTMHIAENLVFVPIMVGMIFFLIEFYRGDKILAFMVLSLVWLCEVFSVISLRSTQGIHFFPRIFFLLFALFHFYVFSFPFGFSYTALASTVCFMVHSMLFFWHRYELPAVALGIVTLEHPRMGLTPSPTSIPSLHAERRWSNPPVIPSVALSPPHQLVRQSSHGTAASSLLGRQSRQASSNGLFHAGEDDESYMYFMDGEVVMHRDSSRRTPSPFNHSAAANTSSNGGSSSIGEDGPSRVGGIPDRILAEVGVLNNNGAADDDLFHSFDDDDLGSNSGGGEHGHGNGDGHMIVDAPETSALQAILNVHETPRTDNLSSDFCNVPQEGNGERMGTAPSFPHLPRRKKDE